MKDYTKNKIDVKHLISRFNCSQMYRTEIEKSKLVNIIAMTQMQREEEEAERKQ